MVFNARKLWFNSRMLKDEAIELLGGSVGSAAEVMGVTYQAVNKWPEFLPRRISDRVLGACVRTGGVVPPRFVEGARNRGADAMSPPALPHQAQAAIKSEARQTVREVA